MTEVDQPDYCGLAEVMVERQRAGDQPETFGILGLGHTSARRVQSTNCEKPRKDYVSDKVHMELSQPEMFRVHR